MSLSCGVLTEALIPMSVSLKNQYTPFRFGVQSRRIGWCIGLAISSVLGTNCSFVEPLIGRSRFRIDLEFHDRSRWIIVHSANPPPKLTTDMFAYVILLRNPSTFSMSKSSFLSISSIRSSMRVPIVLMRESSGNTIEEGRDSVPFCTS